MRQLSLSAAIRLLTTYVICTCMHIVLLFVISALYFTIEPW